jgi:molybdopterin/thiamine biosynthesis adenylyltransferase
MKIDKYDRQVRIWGTKGQKKLSFAKIAVLGCCGASI